MISGAHRARIDAAVRMLVASGDMTPTGAHILARVLDADPADDQGGRGSQEPSNGHQTA